MAQSRPDPQPEPWEILSPHQEAMIEACKAGKLAQLQRLFEEHHVKQGDKVIHYGYAKEEGAPATALLFHPAISHGQQATVRYLHSIYPDFDFSNPSSVRTLAKTRDLDMLKLIYSYSPSVVKFWYDDHMTSMLSLAIEEGPQNAPFILFLLDHGAMSPDNAGYIYNLGAELLPAITYDQPIEVIKKMVPLTGRLSFPKMCAIERKCADALEVFLNEEQRRMPGTQFREELESTLRMVDDKESIAVVERCIHKFEQQAAKDAQKRQRSTKKWWQFGMGEKPTDTIAPTDSSSTTGSRGSSWWPSLSKTRRNPKPPEMIQQKKVFDSSSDEENV